MVNWIMLIQGLPSTIEHCAIKSCFWNWFVGGQVSVGEPEWILKRSWLDHVAGHKGLDLRFIHQTILGVHICLGCWKGFEIENVAAEFIFRTRYTDCLHLNFGCLEIICLHWSFFSWESAFSLHSDIRNFILFRLHFLGDFLYTGNYLCLCKHLWCFL